MRQRVEVLANERRRNVKSKERTVLLLCCSAAVLGLVVFVLTNLLVPVTADYDLEPQPTVVVRPANSLSPDYVYLEMIYVVRVEMIVGKDGRVLKARIIESDASEEINDASLDAARRWQFAPAMKNGREVNSKVVVPFKFSVF